MPVKTDTETSQISPAPAVPKGDVERLSANSILERRDVKELRELVELRRKGWDSDALDATFKPTRDVPEVPDPKTLRNWFRNAHGILAELDDVAQIIPKSAPLEFLDLGCAPGGFSTYILDKNPLAHGVGVTLPLASGGHPTQLAPRHRKRYELVHENILRYDLSPSAGASLLAGDAAAAHTHALRPIPEAWKRHFRLVLLDAHPLRTYRRAAPPTPEHEPEPEGPASESAPSREEDPANAHTIYSGALFIAQLALALETLAPGGTLVLKLTHLEKFPAAHVLFLLDRISASLVVRKSHTTHTVRGTFYAVARGVCPPGPSAGSAEDVRAGYVEGLRALWTELWLGGENGLGRRKRFDDLDFVVTTDVLLDSYVDRLVEFGRDVWATQVAGLRDLFRRKGVQ